MDGAVELWRVWGTGDGGAVQSPLSRRAASVDAKATTETRARVRSNRQADRLAVVLFLKVFFCFIKNPSTQDVSGTLFTKKQKSVIFIFLPKKTTVIEEIILKE